MVYRAGEHTKKLAEKRKVGRPPIVLDEAKVYELASTMLPVESIAIILECSKDTLYAKYSDILHAGRENRKRSLIAAMWYNAIEAKNVQMQIWMSKQHLGYKDSMPDAATNICFNVMVNEIPR